MLIIKDRDKLIDLETKTEVVPLFEHYKTPQDYINMGIVPVEPMTAKEEGREKELERLYNSKDVIAEDKIDGVRATLHFFEDHVRVFSRRISKKTGWYTENTDSVPHIRRISRPELAGTIIDAELTMMGGGFKEVSSTMNCNWDKAIERQLELGYIKANVFDVIYFKGVDIQDRELRERKLILKDVMTIVDSEYLEEVHYFSNYRTVLINRLDMSIIANSGDKYPTLYEEVTRTISSGLVRPLNDFYKLSKKAYYEYYVMQGGEGIMLKDLSCTYRQTRGREYTKVKKFLTRDVVITGFNPPVREYLGKHVETWQYWEDPVTMKKYDKRETVIMTQEERKRLEPITKYYYEGWIGTVTYGVVVDEKDIETWKKINPKEEPIITILDDVKYLGVGETSGLTEEERAEMTDRQEYLIGTVIEVKAHEVIQKTGKFRHPRFLRKRPDKSPESCTIKDHLGD